MVPSSLLSLASVAACVCAATESSLSFASLFNGGAVLQRGTEVTIWGTSSKSHVNLYIDTEVVGKVNVDSTGAWFAKLRPHATSWNSTLKVEDQSGSVSVPVTFGEVLLCSGQSNMQMPVGPITKLPMYPNGTGFAALNGTAESAAAGRYNRKIWVASVQSHVGWNHSGSRQPVWNAVTPKTLPTFSALCWYTGKSLFEHLGGAVPVGLMVGSVGGSPIEFWIPKESIAACEIDDPVCDNVNNKTDSEFFQEYIEPLQPYTIGSVVWDQGERDVYCYPPAKPHIAQYPCLERQLIKNWREGFKSGFIFVAVQLPGYLGDCDPHFSNYASCVPGVFNMRLAQESGLEGDPLAAVVATYDLSCPYGVKNPTCPFGTVHPLDKATVGARVARQIQRLLLREDVVAEGPHVTRIRAKSSSDGTYTVTLDFEGGSVPFFLNGTSGCDDCCEASDFDVSVDGVAWVNTTRATMLSSSQLQFQATLSATPARVRYTANRAFPQCGVFNQEGLPALPFNKLVSHEDLYVV